MWRAKVNPNHDVLTKARKQAAGGRGGRVRGILDICGDQTMCVCVRSASVVCSSSSAAVAILFFCCSPCYEESSLACHSFECGAANLRTGCSMSDAGGVEQDLFRPAAASVEVELAKTELDLGCY